MKLTLQSLKSKKGLIIIGLLLFVAFDVVGVVLMCNSVKKDMSETADCMPVYLNDIWNSAFDQEKQKHLLSGEFRIFEAEKYQAEKNYKKAHEAYLDGIAEFSDCMGANSATVGLLQSKRADFERDFRKYHEAELAYRSALVCLPKDGGNAKIYLHMRSNLGEVLKREHKYPEAIALYTENVDMAKKIDEQFHIKDKKTTLGFMYALSHCYLENRQYDKAVEICDQRVAIARQLPDNKKGLIRCLNQSAYMKTGAQFDDSKVKDYPSAINDLTEAIALAPDEGNMYSSRGEKYLEMKDYPHAIADFTFGIKLKPNETGSLGGRARAYEESGQYDNALADMTEAIEIAKRKHVHTSNYGRRAKVFERMGRYEDALSDYNQHIKEYGNEYAYMERGDLYLKMKQPERAVPDYSQALQNSSLEPATKTKGGLVSYVGEKTAAAIYEKRASAYTSLGKPDLAATDKLKAKKLISNLKNEHEKSSQDDDDE